MKRLIVHLLLLLPVFYLAIRILIIEDLAEPVKYIYTVTGVSATVILFFSICISMIKDKINLMKFRRAIGLYGFFYAFLHLINFSIFDAQLDFEFIVKETIDKPFIYLGMIAFFILLFMSITSIKSLYKKYNSHHRFIYLALILITIHFLMAQKTIDLDSICYIGIILIIGYYKLLQKIVQNNKF